MPYIEHARKVEMELTARANGGIIDAENAGELNYLITCLCMRYLRRKGFRYEHINTVTGALECAKQEFYRRVAVPYEDHKRDVNGDVY